MIWTSEVGFSSTSAVVCIDTIVLTPADPPVKQAFYTVTYIYP